MGKIQEEVGQARNPQVIKQQIDLDTQIEEAKNLLSQLIGLLDPVLKPQSDGGEACTSQPEDDLAPLAHQLRLLFKSVVGINDHLRDTIARLEI